MVLVNISFFMKVSKRSLLKLKGLILQSNPKFVYTVWNIGYQQISVVNKVVFFNIAHDNMLIGYFCSFAWVNGSMFLSNVDYCLSNTRVKSINQQSLLWSATLDMLTKDCYTQCHPGFAENNAPVGPQEVMPLLKDSPKKTIVQCRLGQPIGPTKC